MTLKTDIIDTLIRLTKNQTWLFSCTDGYRLGSAAKAIRIVDWLLYIRKLWMVKSRRRATCLEEVKCVVKEWMDYFFEQTNATTGRVFEGIIVVFDKEAPINKCIGRCGTARNTTPSVSTPNVDGVGVGGGGGDPIEAWRTHCRRTWNHFEDDRIDWNAHCSNVDFKLFIVDFISCYLRDEYRVPPGRYIVNYGPIRTRHDFFKSCSEADDHQNLVMFYGSSNNNNDNNDNDDEQQRTIIERWTAYFQEADAAVGYWAAGLKRHDVYVDSDDGDSWLALLLSSHMRLKRPIEITPTSVKTDFVNSVFWIRNELRGERNNENGGGGGDGGGQGYIVDINLCYTTILKCWYRMLCKRHLPASVDTDKMRHILAEQTIGGAVETFVALCCLCGNDYVEGFEGMGTKMIFDAYFQRRKSVV